jgi:hypothetical protein
VRLPPRWKRTAKPLVEVARTIGFLAAVWKGQYRPAPHAVKMRILRSWLPDAAGMTFIETGTYRGDTVLALRHVFKRLISIEIDAALHELAKSRTAAARNINLVLGDCTVELPKILSNLGGRAAFWLDGHWSGGVTGRGDMDDPILVSRNRSGATRTKITFCSSMMLGRFRAETRGRISSEYSRPSERSTQIIASGHTTTSSSRFLVREEPERRGPILSFRLAIVLPDQQDLSSPVSEADRMFPVRRGICRRSVYPAFDWSNTEFGDFPTVGGWRNTPKNASFTELGDMGAWYCHII